MLEKRSDRRKLNAASGLKGFNTKLHDHQRIDMEAFTKQQVTEMMRAYYDVSGNGERNQRNKIVKEISEATPSMLLYEIRFYEELLRDIEMYRGGPYEVYAGGRIYLDWLQKRLSEEQELVVQMLMKSNQDPQVKTGGATLDKANHSWEIIQKVEHTHTIAGDSQTQERILASSRRIRQEWGF